MKVKSWKKKVYRVTLYFKREKAELEEEEDDSIMNIVMTTLSQGYGTTVPK